MECAAWPCLFQTSEIVSIILYNYVKLTPLKGPQHDNSGGGELSSIPFKIVFTVYIYFCRMDIPHFWGFHTVMLFHLQCVHVLNVYDFYFL